MHRAADRTPSAPGSTGSARALRRSRTRRAIRTRDRRRRPERSRRRIRAEWRRRTRPGRARASRSGSDRPTAPARSFRTPPRRRRPPSARETAREIRARTPPGPWPAPDRDTERDQRRPGPAVAQRAEDRRRQSVDDDESGADQPELCVGQRKLRSLDRLHDRGDDPAVEIVEKVDERENRQRVPRRLLIVFVHNARKPLRLEFVINVLESGGYHSADR